MWWRLSALWVVVEMDILLNGQRIQTDCRSLRELATAEKDMVIIYNGFQTDEDFPLQAGDSVVLIPKGKMPEQNQLEAMLTARHTPQVHAHIQDGAVAIAGLGGLGSNIAVMLAQTGVGRLLLIDYDTVEPSNLNRQHYTLRHLGMPKTEALAQQLREVNPFVQVEVRQEKITAANAAALFDGWPLVCEALDNPAAKAALINALLPDSQKTIVAASGMAGYGSANEIHTVRKLKRLYVCGDETSEAQPSNGLMAPRVQVCAGHQANMILRLLLGIAEP